MIVRLAGSYCAVLEFRKAVRIDWLKPEEGTVNDWTYCSRVSNIFRRQRSYFVLKLLKMQVCKRRNSLRSPPWQDWFIMAMQGTEDKEGRVHQNKEYEHYS
jgi:hypothetical protein